MIPTRFYKANKSVVDPMLCLYRFPLTPSIALVRGAYTGTLSSTVFIRRITSTGTGPFKSLSKRSATQCQGHGYPFVRTTDQAAPYLSCCCRQSWFCLVSIIKGCECRFRQVAKSIHTKRKKCQTICYALMIVFVFEHTWTVADFRYGFSSSSSPTRTRIASVFWKSSALLGLYHTNEDKVRR